MAGDTGDLAGVAGLDAADGLEGVTAGTDCFGDEILEFADLVSAEGDIRIAVLSFGPDLDLATKCLAETWRLLN